MNNFTITMANFGAFKKQTICVILTVASAVLLPQIFHLLGIITGRGAAFSQMFLPMYLPVMIASFMLPLPTVLVISLLSPFISYLLCRMPNIYLLPYMTIELVAMSFSCSVLRFTKLHTVAKVFIAQIVSRLAKIAIFAIVFYIFVIKKFAPHSLISITINGFYGVLLQLFIVPPFLFYLKNKKTK